MALSSSSVANLFCFDYIFFFELPSTEAWIEKPSFGKPLEEHLAVSGREIAFPIEACVTMLLECGMQEEVCTDCLLAFFEVQFYS